MARARNIKPGFFKNDKLAECGPVCMIVFAGLWGIADYRGNMEYRPKRIKIDTIPYFDESIEDCIDTLIDTGFLVKYTVDDTDYLHVVGFERHQNPHKNEKDSGTSIPSIEKARKYNEQNTKPSTSNRADSLLLIPDSLLLIPEIPRYGIDLIFRQPEIQPPRFDDFWEVYPRKTNKVKAESAWAALKPNHKTLDSIIQNINRRFAVGDWSTDDKQFIPHASTYLNQRRWDDEVIPKGASNGSRFNNQSAIIDKTYGPGATDF
jgi:hypothetical protein